MKLQPNFSWQKYEGAPEDQKQQFQYQLQQEHIVIANSINTTIDDASYFTRERLTAFTWIDGRPIYTKTITGTITTAPGTTTVSHGITGLRTLVKLSGTAQDATPLAVNGLPLPYVQPATPNDGIGVGVTPTNLNIITNSATWLNYLFAVTIEYTR